MKIIKVSAGNPEFSGLLLRQTPNGSGIWNNCRFIVNQPIETCDWWVVCHGSGLQKVESVYCDPNHIIYISMEPNEKIGNIKEKFLDQFSHLILCDRNISHPRTIYANGLTWWVGMRVRHHDGKHHFQNDYSMNYDSLLALECPNKMNRISIIISQKIFLEGHKKRLEFVRKIRDLPVGEHIDIFGGGFNPIPDKWDAIAPYKYHLVLENEVCPDYWSEKLADAFLAFAYPIYSGCPNIGKYFSKDSLLPIDISEINGVAEILMGLIESNAYEEHVEAIHFARKRVLGKYNIFQLMAEACDGLSEKAINCRLKPNSYFSESWLRRAIRNFVYGSSIALSLYQFSRRSFSRYF